MKTLTIFCLLALMGPATAQALEVNLPPLPPIPNRIKERASQLVNCEHAGRQLIGLSAEELVKKCGSPDRTRALITAQGALQTMIYGGYPWGRVFFYVHLEDGKVIGFQN